MKRIATLLLSVVFCLTALPWGAVSAATDGNIIINGDFESGKDGWTCNSGTAEIVTDANSGTAALQLTNPGAWGEAAVQTVAVQADTDYTITWYSKRVFGTGAFNLIPMNSNNWNNLSCNGQNWMNETSGNWVKYEITLNTGSTTQVLLKFTSETTNAGSILIDDITMIPVDWQSPDEPDVPSDNPLSNGDFETGDNTGWAVYQGSTVKAEAAHGGAYGLHLRGDGGWGGMAYQNIPVQHGVEYTIQMWLKAVASGVNIQIKDGGEMGTNLAGQWFGATKWTRVEIKVTPTTDILCINFCGSGNGTAASVYLDDVTITTQVPAEPSDELIFNGDFETGDFTGWDNLWGNNTISITEGHDSAYAMSVISGQWRHIRQKVDVEPNTDYLITGWYKDVNKMTLIVKDGADMKNLYQAAFIDGTSEWKRITLTINSGSETSLLVDLMGNEEGARGIFDDFSMKKATDEPAPLPPIEENQLVNGGFEEGEYGWEWHASTHVDYYNSFSGNASAYLDNEKQWSDALTQRVPLRPDTDYVITFYTKRDYGSGAWSLFLMDADTVDSGSPVNIRFEYPYSTSWFQQYSSDGWVKTHLEFNSNNVTTALFKFGPTENNAGTFWLDNVGLYVKGYEPVEPEPEIKEPMSLTSASSIIDRPISDEVNLLDNGSFETAGGPWDVDTFCTEHVSVVEDATTCSGDKSLYFDTSSLSEEEEIRTSFTVAVEPHTSYVFSVWIKGAFLSEDNRGRATIGIVDATGNYLSAHWNAIFMDGTRQIVPSAWDDAWHLRAIEFYTNANTTATIALSGWGSQMWVDDIALFKVEDGITYVSPNMGGNVEVCYDVERTACKDEDSLIPDPSMSTADAADFWAGSDGWRNGFMSFKDGAMKYTSTGDNAATYTIKWVDVEPYTDYTFSVDMKILEDGFGRIGLLDSKKLNKVEFFSISFDSYDYEESGNTGWRTVACTFNSDAYDRIGIAFVDDGGEVLLDNMRLFKTEDGMAAAYGDVNGDGTINTRDVGLLQRYLNGWDVVILTEVADVTGDGKINVQDIARLQRYLCGWDEILGG